MSEDPSDNLLIFWLMEELGLFFLLMITWDIIRSIFTAWLVPKFLSYPQSGLTKSLKYNKKKKRKPTQNRS